MTTNFIGSETVMPETHFEPRRYRVSYCCEKCGHEFARTYKAIPKKDPPCPRPECRDDTLLAEKEREIERLKAMLEAQTPPAHIGANNQVKAIDATADIVMKDYGMTDLKDSVRPGENVAPKLPPAQQHAADNYFANGNNVKIPDFATGGTRSVSKRQMDLIGRRALAGAYRNMSVNQKMVTPDAAVGAPALTKVREERAK